MSFTQIGTVMLVSSKHGFALVQNDSREDFTLVRQFERNLILQPREGMRMAFNSDGRAISEFRISNPAFSLTVMKPNGPQ